MEGYEIILGIIVAVLWIIVIWASLFRNKQSTQEEVKDQLLVKILNQIKKYPNHKKFSHERLYHNALYGFLLHEFSDLKYESQINESRPDLTLGHNHIAIEVKGPTTAKELENVYYVKCNKYSETYEHVVVVLFDVDVTEKKWNWFRDKMNSDYPDVSVIVKS